MEKAKIVNYCPVRSIETYIKYKKHMETNDGKEWLANALKNPIKDFGLWVLIEDQFPWDNISTVHHLIFPKRVFRFADDINDEERKCLHDVLLQMKKDYDIVVDKIDRIDGSNRSIKYHYHLHLLNLKKYIL